jgi:hypothetical protein
MVKHDNVPQPGGGIAPEDFQAFGMEQIAYIRPTTTEQGPAWAVHMADGQEVAVAASPEVAFALIRQHEMEPMRLQ